MSVFTLATYGLVFKVIKDDFGHSKISVESRSNKNTNWYSITIELGDL